MSLVFNDTTDLKGIVQQYEKDIGDATGGSVSGSTTKLKQFTAEANLAFDAFWSIAIPASGTWQFDDSNHTKYPIIKTNIESGRRDYKFTLDEQANLILDIYKVAILPSATATLYQEIEPVDTQSGTDLATVFNDTVTGTPTAYDKTANGIFFDVTPNYSATLGLLVYINREASYFTYTDTTKKPGVPGLFHRWFSIWPAEQYARRNNLSNYAALRAERIEMEQAIRNHFGRRERDVRSRITTKAPRPFK